LRKHRLIIVDQIVNSGGVERFLEECVRALLSHPESQNWEIHLLVNSHNTSGKPVAWARTLVPAGAHVRYLFDDAFHRPFQLLRTPRRVFNLPGTTFLLERLRKICLLSPFKTLRSLAGDSKSYIELFVSRGKFDLGFFAFPFSMDCPNLSIPMVSLPHDLSHKNPEVAPPTASIIERQLPAWLKKSRRLFVNSQFILSEIEKHYPEQASKVKVVRLGIPSSPSTLSDTLIDSLKRTLPEKFILTSGWITPHKDQGVLLRAAQLLRKKGVSIPLVFTGPNTKDIFNPLSSEPYVRFLAKEAKALGLIEGKDIFALGFVDASTLIALYRLASAFVLTSRYEAGSFPVREAIRQGCPVICSDIPPLKEEMEAIGKPALLFSAGNADDLAQKIQSLLENSETVRKTTAASVPQLLSTFSWEKLAKQYFQVFEEVIREQDPLTQAHTTRA